MSRALFTELLQLSLGTYSLRQHTLQTASVLRAAAREMFEQCTLDPVTSLRKDP